ncbi:MAG: DNA-directed RNA polymerase [bacterium]|nr:DNA-directed RNA polymerase [bacterium]
MKPTQLDQLLWETQSIADGVRRYRHAIRRRSAETPPGFAFLQEHLDALTEAIAIEQKLLSPGPGRPRLRAAVYNSLPPEKLALITLNTALTVVCTRGSDATITAIAKEIGELCRLEREYQKLKKTTPQWLRRQLARRHRGIPDHQLVQDKDAVEDINVGASLIGLLRRNITGFKVGFRPAKLGRERYERAATLELSAETAAWLETAHGEVEGLNPIHLPMIVVPVAWNSLSGGGYLTNARTGNLFLVKRLDNDSVKELRAANLTQVYRAVNALQETAWAINAEIYKLMREAWKHRLDVGNLPLRPPDRPAPLPDDASEQAKRNQKLKWRRWYGKRDGIVGAAAMMRMRLKYCRLLKKYPGLYFPCQLDRRGRVYPIPQLFHPQADDAGRALIKFARGKPLTDRGRYWLEIHLATVYGNGWDKKPFDERVGWVNDHQNEIHNSAKRPFDGDFLWCKAENPWRFLAACLEWSNPPKDRGVCVSHLPVSVDGTCNGLQHLSALSRDLAGAQATNLIPSPIPQDIYQNVANLLRSRLQHRMLVGDPLAAAWLPRVNDRKVVKRATMATPYGITPGGIKDALIGEDLAEGFADELEAANYLVKHIQWAIGAAAPGSKQILEWLKEIAKTLKEKGLPVIWTVPTGFRVVHRYRTQKARTVKAGGFSLLVRVGEEDGGEDTFERRQTTAIGANFVHSLDAAHMMLTINHLLDEDGSRFQDFAMDHDGYGVHACDVDELNRVLREEFVRIHTRPLLDEFVAEQRIRTGLELPDPPKPGKGFDLSAVLQSKYFFS